MSNDKLKAERLEILNMLKDGLINASEAEALLNALGDNENKVNHDVTKAPQKKLHIYVDSAEGDKVRIKLPIEFAKLLKSGKVGGVNLNEMNLDMDIDDIIKMAASGADGELVNVVSSDGDVVKITIE